VLTICARPPGRPADRADRTYSKAEQAGARHNAPKHSCAVTCADVNLTINADLGIIRNLLSTLILDDITKRAGTHRLEYFN